MAPTVEKVSAAGCVELGEGPHWDAKTKSLYYVDIFGKCIHKYEPATKKHTKALVDRNHVSFIIPVEGSPNRYLIGVGREFGVVTWDGISDQISKAEKIAEVDTNNPGNRLNDGKCDASGRLWAGTMGREEVNGHVDADKGTLFSLDSNGVVKSHISPVFVSNGLAWNSDNSRFYYIDSPKKVIYQYDFDLENGKISNRQEVFSLAAHNIEGFPDGQTIDTDGNLWIAIFNGYRVIKIDPRKPNTLLQTISLPAKQVTSVAFGGDSLDELYITSASFTIDGIELKPPNHGALFKVTGIGARGFPGVSFKLHK